MLCSGVVLRRPAREICLCSSSSSVQCIIFKLYNRKKRYVIGHGSFRQRKRQLNPRLNSCFPDALAKAQLNYMQRSICVNERQTFTMLCSIASCPNNNLSPIYFRPSCFASALPSSSPIQMTIDVRCEQIPAFDLEFQHSSYRATLRRASPLDEQKCRHTAGGRNIGPCQKRQVQSEGALICTTMSVRRFPLAPRASRMSTLI